MTFTVTRGFGDVRSRPHPVVTIGNFDGHHRGHHSLLQTVVARAREVGGTAMVVTFDPHPIRVLAPHVELRFLTNPEEKLERFMAAGVDEVVFLEFTPALAVMTPDEFADVVLHRRLGVADLFVGEHFAFGKGRVGRIADLERLGGIVGIRGASGAPCGTQRRSGQFHENPNVDSGRVIWKRRPPCWDGRTV